MSSWARGNGSFVSWQREVTGRRGPLGSCQGVLLSQDRSVPPQTLRPARFPPSAADFLICPSALRPGGGGERYSGCVGKGDPVAEGLRTPERHPHPHRLTSFNLGFLLPEVKRPESADRRPAARAGVHLIPPHLGTPRPGQSLGAGTDFKTRPGSCIYYV